MAFEEFRRASKIGKGLEAADCLQIEQQIPRDIDVVILTNKAKPAITAMTLEQLGIQYRLLENPDHDLPPDHPEHKTNRKERPTLRQYAIRQYRAFRGHQLALSTSEKPYTLVFEDDMSLKQWVTRADVLRHIHGAKHFIDRLGYDAVSFHGRNQSASKLSTLWFDREYVELQREDQSQQYGQMLFLRPVLSAFGGRYRDQMFAWHEGCLAYLAGPTARQKWIAAGHGSGMPCDIFLVNELRTLVMRHTIYHHDCCYGSLISNYGEVAKASQQ